MTKVPRSSTDQDVLIQKKKQNRETEFCDQGTFSHHFDICFEKLSAMFTVFGMISFPFLSKTIRVLEE